MWHRSALILGRLVPLRLRKLQGSENAITVGSKAFTEGVILSELYALALEDAGFSVKRSFEISGSLIHTAIENGDIDLYPEYTGTGLISVLKMVPRHRGGLRDR